MEMEMDGAIRKIGPRPMCMWSLAPLIRHTTTGVGSRDRSVSAVAFAAKCIVPPTVSGAPHMIPGTLCDQTNGPIHTVPIQYIKVVKWGAAILPAPAPGALGPRSHGNEQHAAADSAPAGDHEGERCGCEIESAAGCCGNVAH
jgi:hypothetical protein